MQFRILAALLALASSSAAWADTTAVYHARDKSFPLSMTVEIADNGNVRYQMSAGRTYGLVIGGVDYFVSVESKGPIVDRLDDFIAAQKEAMAAVIPAFKGHGEAFNSPELVPIGNVTINGRVGRAYGFKTGRATAPAISINREPGKFTKKPATGAEVKNASANPVVVISSDPELAPIGKVMANQFAKSLGALSGMIGETPGMFTQMDKLLQTGAPLSFAGMELQSVNHVAIDPKRFELPGPPETLDQIRERMKPLPPPPTAEPTKP